MSENLIRCPYKGRLRDVLPEVCGWHREEKDPECFSCDRYQMLNGGDDAPALQKEVHRVQEGVREQEQPGLPLLRKF